MSSVVLLVVDLGTKEIVPVDPRDVQSSPGGATYVGSDGIHHPCELTGSSREILDDRSFTQKDREPGYERITHVDPAGNVVHQHTDQVSVSGGVVNHLVEDAESGLRLHRTETWTHPNGDVTREVYDQSKTGDYTRETTISHGGRVQEIVHDSYDAETNRFEQHIEKVDAAGQHHWVAAGDDAPAAGERHPGDTDLAAKPGGAGHGREVHTIEVWTRNHADGPNGHGFVQSPFRDWHREVFTEVSPHVYRGDGHVTANSGVALVDGRWEFVHMQREHEGNLYRTSEGARFGDGYGRRSGPFPRAGDTPPQAVVDLHHQMDSLLHPHTDQGQPGAGDGNVHQKPADQETQVPADPPPDENAARSERTESTHVVGDAFAGSSLASHPADPPPGESTGKSEQGMEHGGTDLKQPAAGEHKEVDAFAGSSLAEHPVEPPPGDHPGKAEQGEGHGAGLDQPTGKDQEAIDKFADTQLSAHPVTESDPAGGQTGGSYQDLANGTPYGNSVDDHD